MEVFKYLGRIVSLVDNDVPAMRRNLKRARGIWRRLSKVLATEEVPAPVAGMFYQAVVAAMLLYGSKSWSLPPRALKVLEGFHVEAARRLTGMMPEKRGETWTYPKSKEVLAAAHLKTIGEYVTVRRQRAAALVVRRPVMAACRETEAMRGTPPASTGGTRPSTGIWPRTKLSAARPGSRCAEPRLSRRGRSRGRDHPTTPHQQALRGDPSWARGPTLTRSRLPPLRPRQRGDESSRHRALSRPTRMPRKQFAGPPRTTSGHPRPVSKGGSGTRAS